MNIKVEVGDIYCLLGANGAGKSTTINLFLWFIEATSGSISVNGLDVNKKNIETKKYLFYIPENLMLYPILSGLENLEYFVCLANKTYTKDEFVNFLQEVGLQTKTHLKRVSTYSRGMYQKVGIAIALAKHAKVLLLDEPTSRLDPRVSNEFSTLLLTFKEKE